MIKLKIMDKEKDKSYFYLKKDLLKVFLISLVLIIFLLFISLLDTKINFISKLAEEIMKVLIK